MPKTKKKRIIIGPIPDEPIRPDPVSLFLRNLPRLVRDGFKAYCARRGLDMTSVVVEFMREKIQEDGYYAPPRELNGARVRVPEDES